MKALKKAWSVVSGLVWPLIMLLILAVMIVDLYDRFTGNGQAWSFYAPDIDMTCVVGKDEGQKAMYCFREEAAK